ncbi:hypothetical protein K438DRAFT_1756719 [Mycena galopus ATCC 62051]|nr:hypothetical protein K438DRAFT_1756719 [Mycena galopus ATCC 62051]
MCDASYTLPFSAPSSMAFFIPNNIFPYLSIGVVSASFLFYALHHYCPSTRLDRLHNIIIAVEEILDQARPKCRRDYWALIETEARFLRTKLRVSKVYSRLLKTEMAWKSHLQNMIDVSCSLRLLEREVRDIQTSLLVLIQAVHQRKLTEDISELEEIVDATHRSHPSCCAGVRGRDEVQV